MASCGPILAEDGSHLYRFAFLAVHELLLTARNWRNEIERLGPRQVDLSRAERDLEEAVRSLEIWLAPHVIDGKFIDPRDTPDRLDLPGVEQVNIAQELAQSRDGTFSAFGFTERSAHEVVYKLGEETLRAVSFLGQKMDQQALDFLFGPDSPLRTERQGLGEIPAAEASRVKAECLREAEQAWRRVKPRTKKKRSTVQGEARDKMIGALTLHHKYQDGDCLNQDPIGNNELARKADVDKATASAFFKREFKGHSKYKTLCNDASLLAAALRLLNAEYLPHFLYGAKPPGEGGRDEE